MPYPGDVDPVLAAQVDTLVEQTDTLQVALNDLGTLGDRGLVYWDGVAGKLQTHSLATLNTNGEITGVLRAQQGPVVIGDQIMRGVADGLSITGSNGTVNSLNIRNGSLASVMRVPVFTKDAVFAGKVTVANTTTLNGALSVADTTTLSDNGGNAPLILKSASGGQGFMEWRDSTNARRGNFGFGMSASPQKMTWANESLAGISAVVTDSAIWEVNGGSVSMTASFFGTAEFIIFSNGTALNTTGTFAAFSDLKLKENIVDCPDFLDKLMRVRVVNYNLKADTGPDRLKLLGVVAQELEKIFPGLVGESPDYETVLDPDWKPRATVPEKTEEIEVEPARTIERQITTKKTAEITERVVELVGRKYVERLVTRSVTTEEPVSEICPLFDEDGNAIAGRVHRIPQMETVTIPAVMETEIIPAVPGQTEADRPKIERPTGTVTKHIKYSIFVPMLIKALQELKADLKPKPRGFFRWLRS